MATHSSVLAWRIPGTAGPGGLPSMGSHRVGHDWSDSSSSSSSGPRWVILGLWKFKPPTSGSAGKESTCSGEDLGSISGLGRSPGEGKGYPLQYSGLENSMACIVHGVTKSRTWLSYLLFFFYKMERLPPWLRWGGLPLALLELGVSIFFHVWDIVLPCT